MAPFENIDLGIMTDIMKYVNDGINSFTSMSQIDTIGVLTIGFAIFVIGVSIYGASRQWAFDHQTNK